MYGRLRRFHASIQHEITKSPHQKIERSFLSQHLDQTDIKNI